MRKPSKSFFIRTFRINGLLIFISLILLLIRVPLKMIESFLHNETSSLLKEYSEFMSKLLGGISNTLDGVIVLSVSTLLLLVVPELVTRIINDSLANWFSSIWVSLRLKKFLIRQADHEGEGVFKIQQHNKSIRKSVIDIRNKKITYLVELPNDMQAQKLILEAKEILREEISSRFSEYTFSNFERYKHSLRIEGTKVR
ncbi:hypothetical protein [Paenibacillus polymyxa]|uniref:hypothetical protein n=1 Tax=Paenibacillus polymyxa TaxID=1406 RepID=UPI00129B1C50|nr:hypothetical protein [Paenibacillus polymyxa]KAE8561476.1 hypothetical protein BJH92_03520 [Paenibacillus polymyxa]MCJ1222880.1 hypothetical protein [Paenibacillus polymyxa]